MNRGFRSFLLVLLALGSLLLLPWQARTIAVSSAWSTPVNLSLSSAASEGAVIAVDIDGEVIAAWTEEGEGTRVYYTSLPRGGAWSSPADMSGNPGQASDPALVSDAVGTAHVVWEEASMRVTTTSDIMYAYRPRGSNWTAPVPATSDFGSSQFPALTVSANGNVHLVWENFFDMRYAYRSPTGAWSAAANISPESGFSEDACLVADGAADIHLVWQDDRLSAFHPDVYYSIKPQSGGTWSAPVNLSNSGSARSPALARDGTLALHAMWVAADGLGYARKAFGQDWSPPSTPFTGAAGRPALTADAIGTLHVVWCDAATHSILYASRSPGGDWTVAQSISQGAVDSADDPAITLDPEGYPHVVWDHDGEIYYASALSTSSTPTITPSATTATASPTSTRTSTPGMTVTPGPSRARNWGYMPLLLKPAPPPTATPTATPTFTAVPTLTPSPTPTSDPNVVMSGWASVPPEEDGILSPGEWDGAGRIAGSWGTVYIQNDNQNVYVAVDWTASSSAVNFFDHVAFWFDYPFDRQRTVREPGLYWFAEDPDSSSYMRLWLNPWGSCGWASWGEGPAGHTNIGHHVVEFHTAPDSVGRSPQNTVGLALGLSYSSHSTSPDLWPPDVSNCEPAGWGTMVFADAP